MTLHEENFQKDLDQTRPLTKIQHTRKFLKYSFDILKERTLKRNSDLVISEYAKIYAGDWKKLNYCTTLEDWLYRYPTCPDWWAIRYQGKLVKGLKGNPWAVLLKTIESTITKHFANAESITEYGCGAGANLLFLKNRFPHLKCYGYELTHEGVALARELAKRFNLEIQFEQRNYLEDKPVFPKTDLAFTNLSLEQIPDHLSVAISNIHKMTNIASFHIEPIIDFVPKTPWGLLMKSHFKRRNLNSSFMKPIQNLGIKPKTIETVLDSPSVYLYPTLLILPVNKQ